MMSNSNTIENVTITGMTIAVVDMEKMVKFYENVFQIHFEKVNMFNTILNRTTIGDLELLFCPASIAQNSAKQNRHQLNLIVGNLELALSKLEKFGGSKMGEPIAKDGVIEIGIKDPDNNTMVLSQHV